ncbi:MAG: hypothetical protein ACRDNK_03695 [Solirubrobacteraceae bacterium]
MLAPPAVAFASFVLAIHILAVVVAFGATFAYPLIFAAARRADPSVMPWLWSLLQRIDRYLINPGLGVVVLAGIYLASSEHHWGSFFVAWGIGVAIVIGAAVGSFTIPRYGRLAELAERDLAAAGAGFASGGVAAPGAGAGPGAGPGAGGAVAWSAEYEKLVKQVAIVGAILDLLVVITVFVMATHAGT